MSKFNENVKDLFTNWNTIPNWMCFVRIALIPVFSVLFVKESYIAAFIVMIVAALTDVFDGKIATNIHRNKPTLYLIKLTRVISIPLA